MKLRPVLSVYLVFSVIVCAAPIVSARSAEASDENEYFAVFMEGKKIGHSIQSRVVSGGKVTTGEQVSMTLSRMSVPVTVEINETHIETTAGEPLGFKLEQKLGATAITVAGTVDKRGKVDLTTTSMGVKQKSTLQWPQGAVMAEGLRLFELKKGAKEGLQYNVKLFQPGLAQAVDAHIRVGAMQNVDLLGRVVALREMATTLNMPGAGEIVSTSYVDKHLQLQKTTMPLAGMSVELIACAKEFALSQNDVLDLIDKMFLASPKPLYNLASAKSVTYDLVPIEGATNLTIPSDDNQHVEHLGNGNVTLTVKPVGGRPGAGFPYDGSDPAILEAMKPTRFLQADDKDVVALARRAVGDTKDAAEAAKKIEAFVSEYVENRSLSVGYASAAEVAASRQGDCSEFAVLTAAMCRAVGIPARVVVGVAYVNDFAGHRGFGGHAWTQAYVGGKWIGLDASFRGGGRGGYDAGHIALAIGNGNPEDFFNLASTIGQFKVEKVILNK
ncbi:MAG: transglutaminase-like domain-containing protein [Sedimentisphaerales bacterium]|jgi:hypothetical protein